MMDEFEMTNLGNFSYFLGIEFIRIKECVILHQRKYVREVLKKFRMLESNLATSPIEANFL